MEWNANDGVYFGYATDRLSGEAPPLSERHLIRYADDRHLITVGPNGSGKTRRLLLPNLAELTDWSILVVDPKGDLACMTAAHREAAGSKIVRLNPFDALGLGSDGYNPVAALDPDSDEFPDDAMGLAEAVIRVEGREPHWSQSAQELIAALIMYVRIVLRDPSLADVRALLGQKTADLRRTVMAPSLTIRDQTVPGMIAAGIRWPCEALEAKAARFADISSENREMLSVISVALTQTRWLDSPRIQEDLRRGAFDFAEMKERPTTVYLILPARRLATHSTWLRLMITSVLQPLVKDTRRAKVPVLLMLDEFAQLGHLPVIEQYLAIMRGYGIKLWAVFQDFAQAKAIYGERWESFLGNAGVVQSYAPQDVGTSKDISELMGQTTVTPHSGSGGGFGIAEVGVPLVLPQDLRNMGKGYSVIRSHKSPDPIRAFMPWPDELPHLREICALDPSRPTSRLPTTSA